MQLIYDKQPNENCEASSIYFLPIIDMSSSDMSCIFSTLKFVSNIAYKHGKPTVITFDQPLFWKANIIVTESKDKIINSIVVMLGTFHTVMNLLGCIGVLMENSGLSDVLEKIYGENAVHHMLTGKAYSRALRGHLIVDSALNSLIFEGVFLDLNYSAITLQQADDIYQQLLTGSITGATVESNLFLKNIDNIMLNIKQAMEESSKTAKLWFGYQSIMFTVRMLIQADRLGDWHLHLASLQTSLPVFAASGHFNYTKSVYLYLQNMKALEVTNPEVNKMFKDGNFVVRRSERNWSGLPADLIIEQVLMRSLKSTGGLTRGSGYL
jgi:hypothetical protein